MGEKQQWSNDYLKCLLETCIEEINTVGRKGLSLHKDSWKKLGKVLKEKFGLDLTQKQMKNAYDKKLLLMLGLYPLVYAYAFGCL
ncbi:putative Myb/SANT-like domain-containing protein [Helianthus annuus]|nr:putative Myb/SANT-like domain-containing protein [Helianthus annuus]